MRASYVADWSELGSGEAPWTGGTGSVIDVLDVADLESEAAHEYDLSGAREREQVVGEGTAPDGKTLIDGGRTQRASERFVARLRPGVATRCIARVEGTQGANVRVLANEQPVAEFVIDADDDWMERVFELPAEAASDRTHIELRVSGGRMTSFHYWFAVAPD